MPCVVLSCGIFLTSRQLAVRIHQWIYSQYNRLLWYNMVTRNVSILIIIDKSKTDSLAQRLSLHEYALFVSCLHYCLVGLEFRLCSSVSLFFFCFAHRFLFWFELCCRRKQINHTEKRIGIGFLWKKSVRNAIQSKHKKNDHRTFVCCCCCCLSCVFEQKLLIGPFSSFVYIVLRFAAFFSPSTIYLIHTTQTVNSCLAKKQADRWVCLSVDAPIAHWLMNDNFPMGYGLLKCPARNYFTHKFSIKNETI